ncbi:PREDICTED: uncharacterized protein LOC104593562 isoform X2 [Nelumbo nucifera]|uniref:Uncharacterized protein LOC104593562 isoform X2 n=1 Tax=Nelumbo nucifera TaxID=4432 RepID=A0A1U7ZTS5_NELNU|nr:PREDICTED: uncharacterized protein LOC104593562 isoform X2 [Nelumbo nucifera]
MVLSRELRSRASCSDAVSSFFSHRSWGSDENAEDLQDGSDEEIPLSGLLRIAAKRKLSNLNGRESGFSENKKKKIKTSGVFPLNGTSETCSESDVSGDLDLGVPISQFHRSRKQGRDSPDLAKFGVSRRRENKNGNGDSVAFASNRVSFGSSVSKDDTESGCIDRTVLISWNCSEGESNKGKEDATEMEFGVSEEESGVSEDGQQFQDLEEVEEHCGGSQDRGDCKNLKEVDSVIMKGSESSGVGSFCAGDIVWAKAFPYTWWPGWVCKRGRRGIKISFFDCDKTKYFQESEILSFEKNFMEMSKKVGWRASSALECALVAWNHKIVEWLTCPCQISVEDKNMVHPKNVGQCSVESFVEAKLLKPLEVLDFSRRMAICCWVEDAEITNTVRASAQVNAFRQYVSIRQDWMYRETMRLSESCSASNDDVEATIRGTFPEMRFHSSSDNKVMLSVTRESEPLEDQVEVEEPEVVSVEVQEDLATCMKSKVNSWTTELNEESEPLWSNQIENVNLLNSSMERVSISVDKSASAGTLQQLYMKDTSKESDGTELHKGHYHTDASARTTCETNKQRWDDVSSPCRLDDCILSEETNSRPATLDAHSHDNPWIKTGSNELNFCIGFPMKSRVSSRAQNSNSKQKEFYLDDMLSDLCCLALDPFYSGKESLKTLRKRFLTYRCLAYQNISDVSSKKKCPIELSDTQVLCHVNNGSSVKAWPSVKVDAAVNSIDIDPLTMKVEKQFPNDFSVGSLTRLRTRTYPSKDGKIQCLHDILIYMRCLALDPFYSEQESSVSVSQKILIYRSLVYRNLDIAPEKYTCHRGHEIEAVKTMEVSLFDSALHQSTVTRKKEAEGHSGITVNNEKSQLTPCDKEDTVEMPSSGKISNEVCCEVMKVDCSSSHVKEHFSVESVPKDIVETNTSGRAGIVSDAAARAPLPSRHCGDLVKIEQNNDAGVVSSMKGNVSTGKVSEDGSNVKKLGQEVAPDFSSKSVHSLALFPLNRFYACALERADSSREVDCQASNVCSEVPTSLHMKFPRDFNMPSRDELVKKFRPFGPIDQSKTKVFFYTGSAKVFFLHRLDAVAAYQFAKRKKQMFGGANVRYWLDQHEHARAGTTNISAPSLCTKGKSTSNLKSCLRTCNLLGENDQRKTHKVKFLMENKNETTSLANKVKNKPLVASDSYYKDCSVGPDISLKMLVLLEKCNQLVHKIKEKLGCPSYYSIFAQDYFMNLDD